MLVLHILMLIRCFYGYLLELQVHFYLQISGIEQANAGAIFRAARENAQRAGLIGIAGYKSNDGFSMN